MEEFQSCPSCRDCPLWQGAKHVGIPSRTANFGVTGKSIALFVVGEAPGYYEDGKGEAWVHTAGHLLHRLLDVGKFQDEADIFIGNAVRCFPAQNTTPTAGQVNLCRSHLEADLNAIRAAYPTVYVLCAGSKAALAAGHKSLKTSFHYQGHIHQWFDGIALPTFFTYHPAALLPGRSHSKGRQPSYVRAVRDHLALLHGVITGSRHVDCAVVNPVDAPVRPDTLPDVVALDIETYGILAGVEQTVFHPRQSESIDKIPVGQQIVTVAISWDAADGEHHGIFVWQNPLHRDRLRAWILALARNHKTLIGQNVVFDLLYLKHNDPFLRYLLTPCRGLVLDDLSIINHLDYELRPEKSLKPLSELMGTGSYEALTVNPRKPEGRASGPLDHALWRYNATDTANTLRLRKVLLAAILERYGAKSPKLRPTCGEFRSQLLWVALAMAETGAAFDIEAVRGFDTTYGSRMDGIARVAQEQYGIPFSGKGSDKPLRNMMYAALVESMLVDPSHIEFTQKTKKIAITDKNINLALQNLPKDHLSHTPISLFAEWKNLHYRVTHFTGPLLTKPRRGISESTIVGDKLIGFAFPSWYVVPSIFAGGDDEKTSGTIQGRITCTKPPLQTYPDWMLATIVSRFPGGVITKADESHLELRVAALLSGDPVMMDIFARGLDPHGELTRKLLPEIPDTVPDWRSIYRHGVGKRGHFLTIYGGGADKFQQALQMDIGHRIDVPTIFPLARCEAIIRELHSIYHVYFAWADSMIRLAGERGCIEAPTGWSRTFSGGYDIVARTYANECVNFPIQTISAQLVQSAQYAINLEFRAKKMKAIAFLNIYDAVWADSPTNEAADVKEIMRKHLTNPPLMPILTEEYRRTVPLCIEFV